MIDEVWWFAELFVSLQGRIMTKKNSEYDR